MSTIYDVANVKGFIRMCNDGWLQGWHERNGVSLFEIFDTCPTLLVYQ